LTILLPENTSFSWFFLSSVVNVLRMAYIELKEIYEDFAHHRKPENRCAKFAKNLKFFA
jgi:hypothetical protein